MTGVFASWPPVKSWAAQAVRSRRSDWPARRSDTAASPDSDSRTDFGHSVINAFGCPTPTGSSLQPQVIVGPPNFHWFPSGAEVIQVCRGNWKHRRTFVVMLSPVVQIPLGFGKRIAIVITVNAATVNQGSARPIIQARFRRRPDRCNFRKLAVGGVLTAATWSHRKSSSPPNLPVCLVAYVLDTKFR